MYRFVYFLVSDYSVSRALVFSKYTRDFLVEHGSAVSHPLSFRGPEFRLKFSANGDLKIKQFVDTSRHRTSMEVARSYLWAPGLALNSGFPLKNKIN